MKFFEMLLMSRKMFFEDGAVILYGQKVLVFPSPSLIQYIQLIGSIQGYSKDLYVAAKNAMLENKQEFTKAYTSENDPEWVLNLVNLYGLGKVYYEDKSKAPLGIVLVENSPFSVNLTNKEHRIEHILRGIIAGILSGILNKDIDAIEIEPTATEKDKCKLVLDTKENLNKNYAQKYAEQI